jgi:DNA-binding PadR family transcriptional regulator
MQGMVPALPDHPISSTIQRKYRRIKPTADAAEPADGRWRVRSARTTTWTAPMPDPLLNETEQLVLLALLRLGDDAYGVPIRGEILDRAGRTVSLAAVYATLDRLDRRGFVTAWLSEPIAERGGRARKHFTITRAGARALRDARDVMTRMWKGVELPRSQRAR